MFNQTCDRYILQEAHDPNDRHYFNANNGFLHFDGGAVDHNEWVDKDTPYLYATNVCLQSLSTFSYCSDYTEIGGDVVHTTFMCFGEEYSDKRFIVYAIGLCISCVFLLATLIVYGFLPKVRNRLIKTSNLFPPPPPPRPPSINEV